MNTLEKVDTPSVQLERTRSGPTFVPSVDILETESELRLLADVPGARPDGVDVHYDRGILTLHAQVARREAGEPEFLLREYGVGDFHRSFEVGDEIDADAIRAELNSGVLTVHLPKRSSAQPRKISVKAQS